MGYWEDKINRLREQDAIKKRQLAHDNSLNFVPGFDRLNNRFNDLEHGYENRAAPQIGPSQYDAGQAALGQQLAREAGGNGIGQGLIRAQAQGQADRGMQQQMAMAAGARPGQSALATRGAMMNAGAMNAQVGGQSAQAMGQYQLGAQGQYGQFLQGARGQDDQRGQANADARLRQLGLNDDSQMKALSQRLQLSQMQQQGGQNYLNRVDQWKAREAAKPSGWEQAAGLAMGGAQGAAGLGWRPFGSGK